MVDRTCLLESVTVLPISPEAKSTLLSSLWGPNLPSRGIQSAAVDTNPFFEYYSQQCDIFSVEQSTIEAPGNATQLGISTHHDLVGMIEHIRTTARDRKHTVHDLQRLQPGYDPEAKALSYGSDNEDQIVNNSMDWAARILTMMEIGRPRCAFSVRKPLLWDTGSLREFVANHFNPEAKEAGHVRLQKIFHARNLERLAGIQIEWTNNLADHLTLKDDDTKVLIFHHATFLEQTRR